MTRDLEDSIKYAFTLAEVLITLGVVGVVAAMTMPSLISNVQATINKNKFKKALNTLNQAVTLAYAKEEINFANTNVPCYNSLGGGLKLDSTSKLGGPDNSFCSIFNSTLEGAEFVGSIMAITEYGKRAKHPLQFSQLEQHSDFLDLIGYQLKDGTIFALDRMALDCTKVTTYGTPTMNYGSVSGITSHYQKDGGYKCYGFIDVNGTKGPNKLVNVKGEALNFSSTGKINAKDIEVTDIFPILFYDGVVTPATSVANAVLQMK